MMYPSVSCSHAQLHSATAQSLPMHQELVRSTCGIAIVLQVLKAVKLCLEHGAAGHHKTEHVRQPCYSSKWQIGNPPAGTHLDDAGNGADHGSHGNDCAEGGQHLHQDPLHAEAGDATLRDVHLNGQEHRQGPEAQAARTHTHALSSHHLADIC